MFANLIPKIISNLFGSRLILGITVAAVGALGVMGWFTVHTLQDAASAKQRETQLREALAETTDELKDVLAERDKLDKALEDKRKREEAARERARSAEKALKQLEAEHEDAAKWGGTRVPDDVVDWLRGDQAPSDADKGGS